MKKLFFAALVATVAVGGAFASQNSSSVALNYNFKAPNESNCIQVDCDPNNLGTTCTSIPGQYYQLNTCSSPITPSGKRP